MEVRIKNKLNKENCSKQATKKAFLGNACMGSAQNTKKPMQKIDSLKKPKGNPQVRQRGKQMRGLEKGSCDQLLKGGNILRLCRSTSSKIRSKYIAEPLLTKSSIAKKTLIEPSSKGISRDCSHKMFSQKKSQQKTVKRKQTGGKDNPNDRTKAKKERKFTDVCLTETKSKHKLIKRVLTTEWLKAADEGKTEVRLQNQQQTCMRKSIICEEAQNDHLKSKNETKVGSESTLITDQTSQVVSQNSSGCNSRVVEEAPQKKKSLKFNVNLSGLKSMQILDYTDEFMSHYDELSESWQRDITTQKRF